MDNINSCWVTADRVVEKEAAYICGVILTASSAGAATVTIRDGHNTGGEAKIVVGAVASTTEPVALRHPILCDQGVFVDVGSNVTGVLIQTCAA